MRKNRLETIDDGLEGGAVKVFVDRGRDRQQRTESRP